MPFRFSISASLSSERAFTLPRPLFLRASAQCFDALGLYRRCRLFVRDEMAQVETYRVRECGISRPTAGTVRRSGGAADG